MEDSSQLGNRLLVVFDGQCGLCNRSVRWLLHRDTHDRLRFAPSSHPALAALLAGHEIPREGPDTLLVFRTQTEPPLTRSNATLACLRVLPPPWPTLAALATLVPRPLRDLVYRLVARFRYRVWGMLSACPIPTTAERRHFL